MRSMVEGPTLATIHDKPQSCVQIFQDIACSYPQCLKTQIHKCSVSAFIALRSVAHAMRFAINFDCQATIKTGKVEYVAADWELPSEPQAARPCS